jgi:hypothetical protein
MNVFLVYSKESNWNEREALEMLLKAVFDNVYTWNPSDLYSMVTYCDLIIVLTNPSDEDGAVKIGRGINDFMENSDRCRVLWITNDLTANCLHSHMFNSNAFTEPIKEQYEELRLHGADYSDWKHVTTALINMYEGCSMDYDKSISPEYSVTFSKVFACLLERSIRNSIDYPPVLEKDFAYLLSKVENYIGQIKALSQNPGEKVAYDKSDVFTEVPTNNLLLLYKHNQR